MSGKDTAATGSRFYEHGGERVRITTMRRGELYLAVTVTEAGFVRGSGSTPEEAVADVLRQLDAAAEVKT
jgi:hypothetical protein